MSELSEIFDTLGEEVVPEIMELVFPDTMYILRDDITAGPGGGQIKSGDKETSDEPLPCSYEPRARVGMKEGHGGQLVSVTQYDMTFPSNQFGEAIDVLTSDRLKVLARGNQPEKLFKVINVKNESGVVLTAICELENAA